jgi:hypothetical protein
MEHGAKRRTLENIDFTTSRPEISNGFSPECSPRATSVWDVQSIESDKCPETNFVVGGQPDGIAFFIIWNGRSVVHFDHSISCGVDVREGIRGCDSDGLVDPDNIT